MLYIFASVIKNNHVLIIKTDLLIRKCKKNFLRWQFIDIEFYTRKA